MDAPTNFPPSSSHASVSPQKEPPVSSSGKSWREYMGVVALVLAIGALVFWGFGNSSPVSPTGLVTAPVVENSVANSPVSDDSPLDVSQTLSRQTYFQEAYAPARESYDIFEKASVFTGKSLSEMPEFFSLKNEEEIFYALPLVPSDFGEIAYLFASGRFFAIDDLDETYFKQPELYPGFKENGLRFWTKPDATSWATNGYGTYPAEQFAEISKSEDGSFVATVFLYSSFGVQTFQGMTLFADAASQKLFDIEISPDTFILEPNFPKFYEEWAKKITIRGTPKSDTPPGKYVIAVNVGVPPSDKQKEWSLVYRTLYMDGASGIRPSGNQITLNVDLKE